MSSTKQQRHYGGITLLGLGPGDASMLTQEALDWLRSIKKLHLRTKFHPTVVGLPSHLTLVSFDAFYEKSDAFEAVYEAIVAEVLRLGQQPKGVTYAVPGHPFVAEATCPEIYQRAVETGIPVRVIHGLSFLEPTFLALEIDPFPELVLMDAIQLSLGHTPGFPPSSPALVVQIYSRAVASDVKLTLMAAYPDEHPVRLVHGAGTEEQTIEDMPLYAIDHSQRLGLLSSLFIPPISETASFETFQEIIARLRAPDGCPWDREQTHSSLRPFLLEEAYETLDAIDREDMVELEEELGDLLLQVVLHAQIATEEGDFNIHNVLEGIGTKLVRRHPHVFSQVKVDGVSGVIRNWEAIKAEERVENGIEEKKGLMDGVPKALPALSQAQAVIDRAGRVGFDELIEKGTVKYILQCFKDLEKSDDPGKDQRFGELLLALAALAYRHDIDVESALRERLKVFREKFSILEAKAAESGRPLAALSSEEKAALWEKAIQAYHNGRGAL